MINRRSIIALLNELDSDRWETRVEDGTTISHRWLSVLEFHAGASGSHWYGLTSDGDWRPEYSDRQRIMKRDQAYGFFVLLEKPRGEILGQLRDSISFLGLPEVVITTFPFDLILESALDAGGHWQGCAEAWLDSGYPPTDKMAALVPQNRTVLDGRRDRQEEIFGA